jgi:rod shape-determining protein MreD
MKPRSLLLLVLFGYALTVLQATLQALVPVRVLVPELGLLVALYAGLTARTSVSAACAAAFALGYVTDLLAGAPKGLHAFVYVLLCLLAKGASVRLLLSGTWMSSAFAFVASLLGALVVLAARAQLDGAAFSSILIAPLQAAVTALFAPVVFGVLKRAARRPRARASAGGVHS